MENTSNTVIQNMFNHLAASYSVEEAANMLVQKYPEASPDIVKLAGIDPAKYTVTKVDMGKKTTVIEANPEGNSLLKAVQAKVKPAKAKPAATATASKRTQAQELFNNATDKSRSAIIDLFVAKLGMTRAGASTYFYSVKN